MPRSIRGRVGQEAKEEKTLKDLQGEHKPPPTARRQSLVEEAGEKSAFRNYVRDLILGFNDGIVSVYAVVAGLTGAGFLAREIAVAGVAASIAGAMSMGLGEYVSTKGQAEYYRAEAERERRHIRTHPQLEREEIREILEKKGFPTATIEDTVEWIASDEDRFVDFMMREEFGVGDESGRSPLKAMGLVVVAFLVGAGLSVLPFILIGTATSAAAVATTLSLSGLFFAGAVRGRSSGLNWVKTGGEMLILGAAAAIVTFAVGSYFGVRA
ncbi:MAG: VIT1/CCC1 transporter family protein [Euryarchaeota archaeon]|nr:VIT1/CCC1 transporter family protein [Euryarchaeota archaeon]